MPPTRCWPRSRNHKLGPGWSRPPTATGSGSTSACKATRRPPSLPSDDSGGLLGPLFSGSGADPELSDRALLQAILDAERALAMASARAGLVPEEAAAAIGAVCQADRFDPGELGRRAGAAGNPVVPPGAEGPGAGPTEGRPGAAPRGHPGGASPN